MRGARPNGLTLASARESHDDMIASKMQYGESELGVDVRTD